MPAKDLWRGSEASPVVLLDGLGPRLGFRALSHTLLPSHWNCWLSWRLRVGNGHGVPTRLSWRAPPHLIWPSRSRHVASTWPPHLAQGRHVASVQRSRWPITFREPSTLPMQVRHRSVISRSRLCGEKATVSDFCAITVTGPPNSHAHGGASRMCDSCLCQTVIASRRSYLVSRSKIPPIPASAHKTAWDVRLSFSLTPLSASRRFAVRTQAPGPKTRSFATEARPTCAPSPS